LTRRREPRTVQGARDTPATRTGTRPASDQPITVTATEAQNEFGRVFERAVRDDVVVITRHNAPRAVLMSIDRYNALVGAEAAALDTLTDEFDALLTRMQSPSARAGMEAAFNASPRELGKAAVAAAKSRARGR
jgi:antitoxin Phd